VNGEEMGAKEIGEWATGLKSAAFNLSLRTMRLFITQDFSDRSCFKRLPFARLPGVGLSLIHRFWPVDFVLAAKVGKAVFPTSGSRAASFG